MNKLAILFLCIALCGCAGAGKHDAALRNLYGQMQPDDPQAQFALANELAQSNRLAEAAFWYRKAANQAHVEAQTVLGLMHQNGEGVPQNHTEAAYWFEQAAGQGHSASYAHLGRLYAEGLGVAHDPVKAIAVFLEGAEAGDPECMLRLGLACLKGEGVDQNFTEAYFWLDLAQQLTRNSGDNDLKRDIRTALNEVKKEIRRPQVKHAVKLQRDWYATHLGY